MASIVTGELNIVPRKRKILESNERASIKKRRMWTPNILDKLSYHPRLAITTQSPFAIAYKTNDIKTFLIRKITIRTVRKLSSYSLLCSGATMRTHIIQRITNERTRKQKFLGQVHKGYTVYRVFEEFHRRENIRLGSTHLL